MITDLMSEKVEELALALSTLQGVIVDIPKDKEVAIKNKEGRIIHKYKYAELGKSLSIIRPFLCDHGLAISQLIQKIDEQFYLTTFLLHKSGQWLRSIFPLFIMAPSSQGDSSKLSYYTTQTLQAAGSAISYARRYSILSILGINGEDDDDGYRVDTTYKDKIKDNTGNFTPNTHSSRGPDMPLVQQDESIITKRLRLVSELKNLCTNSGIELEDFGKRFNLDSYNLNQMQDAISKFNDLVNEMEIV